MQQFRQGPSVSTALKQPTEIAPSEDPRGQVRLASNTVVSQPGVQGVPGTTRPMSDDPLNYAASVASKEEVAPSVDPRDSTPRESVAAPSNLPPMEIPVARRGRDGRFDITFDHIKFDIEKDAPFDRSLLTDQVEMLSGEPIRIRGYILNTPYQEFSNFVLVRDNLECCFGPGAALYDCIIVKMRPGQTASYTVRPVTVEGVFKLSEMKDPFDESKTVAIYELQGEKVR